MIQIQNLRQIKNRLKSIANTRQITKAMEMVSASKLNKVKSAFHLSRPYAEAMQTMLYDIISDCPGIRSVLVKKREAVNSITLLVITSDTGLCAGYNDNIIKFAEQFLKSRTGHAVDIMAIGREGYNYFRNSGYTVGSSYLNLYGRYSPQVSDEISARLIQAFLDGSTDEVYVVYTIFNTTLRHAPVVEKLLNIEPVAVERKYYAFEPSSQALMDSMAFRFITQKVRSIILEAFTSEHFTRMLAMKTATENADELTDELTLARNKARQFAITKEVLEIAASAEALKG